MKGFLWLAMIGIVNDKLKIRSNSTNQKLTGTCPQSDSIYNRTSVYFYPMQFSTCTNYQWGRPGRDPMVVGFTTTYAISAYHHLRCECEPRSDEMYSIQPYVIKFVSDLQQGSGFPPSTPVSSTNRN